VTEADLLDWLEAQFEQPSARQDGEYTIYAIAERWNVSRHAAYQRMAKLERAGIVSRRRVLDGGHWKIYWRFADAAGV